MTTGRASTSGYERAVLFSYLRMLPVFERCTDEQLAQVEAVSRFEQHPSGAELVRQGEPGEDFYVVLAGAAQVVRDGATVATLGPGDFFGELALFDPAPRNSTVRATEAVATVALSGDAFQELLATSEGVRTGVLRGMANRLHEHDSRI